MDRGCNSQVARRMLHAVQGHDRPQSPERPKLQERLPRQFGSLSLTFFYASLLHIILTCMGPNSESVSASRAPLSETYMNVAVWTGLRLSPKRHTTSGFCNVCPPSGSLYSTLLPKPKSQSCIVRQILSSCKFQCLCLLPCMG